MIARILAALTILSFTACAASSTPPTNVPGSVPAVMKPNAFITVDIHIVNESSIHVETQTLWSYPSHPFWTNAQKKCIDPGANWHTFIDYNYASPQAEVVAYERNGSCSAKAGLTWGHHFKDIHIKNGRGLLQYKVRNKRYYQELCWKQGDETDYTCHDFDPFNVRR